VLGEVMTRARSQVVDDCSTRNQKVERPPVAPVALGALSMRAPSSAIVAPVPKRRKVAKVPIGDQHDVAAASPVAPVRAAAWYVSLTPEADASVSAGSSFDLDPDLVVKHRVIFAQAARKRTLVSRSRKLFSGRTT
jgi:hypothetical protein